MEEARNRGELMKPTSTKKTMRTKRMRMKKKIGPKTPLVLMRMKKNILRSRRKKMTMRCLWF